MTVPNKIFTIARNNGFTIEGACALLANIQAESAFNPKNLEDSKNRALGMSDEEYTRRVDEGTYQDFVTDGAGYGLAQWTWRMRKQDFIIFARQRGDSIGDFNMQMAFLIYEMKKSFVGCWNMCRSSTDLYEVTKKLLYEWENPDQKEKAMPVRYGYAQIWFEKYRNWNGASDDTTDSGGERMTQQQAVEKVLTLARGEIGYHEQGNNWTKYAQDLDRTNWYNGAKNGYAWCDVFVDWLFWKSFGDPLGREMICQPTGSAGAGCLYSAQYYKAAGKWYTTNPQPGDQIFFTYAPSEYSHTGIVESVQNGVVTTIEGNTSDQVARRQYTVGSANIAGYGRPKWELATGASPTPTPQPSGGGSSSSGLPEGFYRILKQGMKGDDVLTMQEMLEGLGYDLGPYGADGDFGGDTYTAVRKFQSDYNLYVDGEAGEDTLGKLVELTGAKEDEPEPESQSEPEKPVDAPTPVSLKELNSGDVGEQVTLAQALLRGWGYSVNVTGIFSGEFETKIRKFQTDKKLDIDGVIGRETWKALLSLPIE